MTFGKNLRRERNKLGLTVEDVAKNCGISRSYITLIENGKRAPGKKILAKIALALKVKTVIVLDWYLDGLREELQKASPFQIS